MSIDFYKLKSLVQPSRFTEDRMLDFDCVVYWVREESMTDYEAQGYIGVTRNIKRRIKQHESACRCDYKTYHQHMKEVAVRGDFVVDILFDGSISECFTIEHLLRPSANIGWNKRCGGGKVLVGADMKVMKIFRNMKHQAKIKGLSVLPLWKETLGYFDFESFYKENYEGGSLEMVIPSEGEVNKNTLRFVDRKMMIRSFNSKLDFFGDGVLMSNVELSELLGISKPNTLAAQRKRGWSNGKIFMKAWFNVKD